MIRRIFHVRLNGVLLRILGQQMEDISKYRNDHLLLAGRRCKGSTRWQTQNLKTTMCINHQWTILDTIAFSSPRHMAVQDPL